MTATTTRTNDRQSERAAREDSSASRPPDLSPRNGSRRATRWPVYESTDDQLLDRYGPLIWRALVAFSQDLGYVTDMVEAANLAEVKRSSIRQTLKLRKLRDHLGTKVRIDDECWTWLGATTKGSPIMNADGRAVTVRRWTVEQTHGSDDTRWMVQATCGNGLCVHPDHATWRHRPRKSPR